MNDIKKLLIYLGSLPFIIAMLFFVFPSPYQFAAFKCLISYGTIILSFMAGSHWGITLKEKQDTPLLFLSSNLIALLAWITLLFFPFQEIPLFLLIIGFIYQLYLDKILMASGVITIPYFKTRINITLIVFICLLVSFLRVVL